MVPSEDGPLFYIVHSILVNNNENVTFILKWLSDVFFNNHMDAYEVITHTIEWKCMLKEQLYGCIVTNRVRVNNGKEFIVKNWF